MATYGAEIARGMARSALAVTCAVSGAVSWSADAARAQQVEAKLEPAPSVYCTYYDAKENKDLIGVVVGLKSCLEGDAEKVVAYKPCDEAQPKLLARKHLKKSEIDCTGMGDTIPGDWAYVINAKIVGVRGEDVTLAYEGAQGQGMQTFSFKKSWLEGFKPEANGKVTFLPADPSSKEQSAKLGENFAKFVDANKTGLFQKPEGLVGLVTK